MNDAVLLEKSVLFLAEDKLASVNERNIVAELLKVADDMRGYQHGILRISCEFIENINDFVPDNGVETVCRLIENEQFCIVRKCNGDAELYFHTP